MLRFLAVVALLVILAGGLGLWEVQRRWQQPLAFSEEENLFVVEPGDSLSSVAYRLQRQKLYNDPLLIRIYGRITGIDQHIRHGEYLVPRGATAEDLLHLLKAGKVVSYQVTLPEGITLSKALQILAREEMLLQELTGPDDERLLQLVAPHESPEGWFFPDTYRFERGASDLDIMRRAHRIMRNTLETAWEGRAENLPYASPYDALIMASIIERETGLPEEREQIAGVFVRRLNSGMLLQTDPTIIYGLGPEFDGNLRRRHLTDDANPFNTYRHRGLPPSPIALPGAEAIYAALHPDDGETLYFVARGDGGHQFSATLAEHQRAVRKYQLKRRADYRSSPQTNQ